MGIFDFLKGKKQKPNWISKLPKEFAEWNLGEIKSNPQACSLDEIPQGIGKFGHELTNPIPVYGLPSNEVYLRSLLLRDGSTIRWRRVGSMGANNITKSIDQYEIFDMKGDTICFLHISPYHWKVSDKAPSGFKFK